MKANKNASQSEVYSNKIAAVYRLHQSLLNARLLNFSKAVATQMINRQCYIQWTSIKKLFENFQNDTAKSVITIW